MDGLKDLVVERFGKDGWLFAQHRTVPGLTLFAPTLDELKSRLPGALALILKARLGDVEAALGNKHIGWHFEVANSNDQAEQREFA